MIAHNRWPPAREEHLRKLWDAGLTASECAKELGDGMTRNAVIGKVTRLKLQRDDGWTPERDAKLRELWATPMTHAEIAAKIGSWCTKGAVSARAIKIGLAPRGQQIAVPPRRPPPMLKPIKVEDFVEIPPTDRVALVDLQHHHCRWPIGDPTSPHFGFCGCQRVEPTNPFNQYCARHGAIAYVPSRNARALTEEHKAKLQAARAKASKRQWSASK